MKTIRRSSSRVVLGEPDPTVTPAAGFVLVAELERVLGVTAAIDAAVGPIKARRQGHGAGGLVLALAEMMLAGGDFLCDLDTTRADQAGAPLRAVAHPPATTSPASRRPTGSWWAELGGSSTTTAEEP